MKEIEDIETLKAAIDDVYYYWRGKNDYHIDWKGNLQSILLYSRQHGQTGFEPHCNSCHLKLLNFARELVGYGPVQHEDKSLRDRRLKICRGCEHYKKVTRSCGTLILGAITAKKNEPCGCYLPIKASFKIFNCPLSKWKDEDSKN